MMPLYPPDPHDESETHLSPDELAALTAAPSDAVFVSPEQVGPSEYEAALEQNPITPEEETTR